MSPQQREFLVQSQHHFDVRDEQLTFDDKPVVQQDRVQEVLQRYYDDVSLSRNGRDSLYARVSAEVYGVSRRAVQRFLLTQESYQTHLPAVRHRVVQPIIASRPFSRWQVDLVDLSEFAYWNLGYSYALTCVDCFSKRAHVRQLKGKSGPGVAAAMRMIFLTSEALPSVVSSDRGTEFTSGEFQAVLSEHGVEHAASSAYHPEPGSGGALQPHLQGAVVRPCCKEWNQVLAPRAAHYNSSVHSTTRRTAAPRRPRRAHHSRSARAAAEGSRSVGEAECQQGQAPRTSSRA